MTIKWKLLIVLTLLVGYQYAAEARLISFSPTEVNFGSVEIGDTAWREVRFRYSGPDSGRVTVRIQSGGSQCFGVYRLMPQGREPHAFLDSIYKAVTLYYLDFQEDPHSLEELIETRYLKLPEELSRQWIFALIGANPVTQIEGISTSDHPDGAGRVILFDRPERGHGSNHSGWGVEFDGRFYLEHSDTLTVRVWFVPRGEGDYQDTLQFASNYREGGYEKQDIPCVGQGALAVKDGANPLPVSMVLLSAFPNPFNSTTTLTFSQPISSLSRLVVLDGTGRELALLREGWNPAGEHRVSWNATGLPSGVYYPTLILNGQSKSVRAVFVR